MRRKAKHFLTWGENGLTLIELSVGVALMGMMMVGISATIFQTILVTVASNNHMQAISNVHTAGQWIIRDGQQAPVTGVTIDNDPNTPTVLTLAWNYSVYGQESHTIVYALSGTNLTRSDNGGAAVVVAKGIINAATDFKVEVATGSSYKVTIKSTFSGFQPESAQLIYYFKPRLN